MFDITAMIGSLTLSQKAQKILAANSIVSNTVKLHSDKQKSGCGYGIEFGSENLGNVKRILYKAGISVSRYVEGDN